MWVSGQLQALSALSWRKGFRYSLARRMTGRQSRSGRFVPLPSASTFLCHTAQKLIRGAHVLCATSLETFFFFLPRTDKRQSVIRSPTDAIVSCLKNSIKIYIETAPTCFGVFYTIIRERFNSCLQKSRLLN